ncbi:unnamed protein product, partial [Vitis vinifera]|uniref:Uncharacterized protein n=1 Tax=Vitis vinifera TaxID=29760 RepID=D7SWY8_VITVI
MKSLHHGASLGVTHEAANGGVSQHLELKHLGCAHHPAILGSLLGPIWELDHLGV